MTAHLCFLFTVIHVVITQQMQHTVDCKVADFPLRTVAKFFILGAALLLLWGHDLWHKKLWQWFDRRHVAIRTAIICALVLLVMLFGMYGIGFTAEAFIYSQY